MSKSNVATTGKVIGILKVIVEKSGDFILFPLMLMLMLTATLLETTHIILHSIRIIII